MAEGHPEYRSVAGRPLAGVGAPGGAGGPARLAAPAASRQRGTCGRNEAVCGSRLRRAPPRRPPPVGRDFSRSSTPKIQGSARVPKWPAAGDAMTIPKPVAARTHVGQGVGHAATGHAVVAIPLESRMMSPAGDFFVQPAGDLDSSERVSGRFKQSRLARLARRFGPAEVWRGPRSRRCCLAPRSGHQTSTRSPGPRPGDRWGAGRRRCSPALSAGVSASWSTYVLGDQASPLSALRSSA